MLKVIEAGGGARRRPPQPPAAAAARPPPPAPAAAQPPGAAGRSSPKPGERDTAVPHTNIRKRTAEHMVRSKATSAHVYASIEVDFEAVERVRRADKDEWKAAEGFSLTYLPFVSRAVVDAIDEYPEVNATFGESELIVHHYVNLGIAVDLDFEGLMVPVVQRRRRQAAPGHRPGDQRPGRQGPVEEAVARRDHRRHLHHHQPRARSARR